VIRFHGILYFNRTPWPDYANEVYRPSDRRLSAKLVPTFADGGCHVASVMDLYRLHYNIKIKTICVLK
jgi:hypothetical protein